jgi:hypothetical protein
LRQLKRSLVPGGVFGLWSNDPPQEDFVDRLGGVFANAEGHRIDFPNPLQEGTSSAGIYIAQRGL